MAHKELKKKFKSQGQENRYRQENRRDRREGRRESQQGVTLLMTLLILASMIVVVLSIGTIIINEIRASGELITTEPAITAAEAGAELGLFFQIRNVGTLSANCAAPTTAALSNNTSLSSCANYFLPNPTTADVQANAEQDYFLYNPVPPQTGSPGYTSVSIEMVSGNSATVNLCSYDVISCATSPDISSTTINNGQQWNSGSLDPTKQYEITILNGNEASIFSISDTNTNGNVGLPSGTILILTTGTSGNVTRKVETRLPQ